MGTAEVGPSPPIGRGDERARLGSWRVRGHDRQPATVVVAGDAGIGKTTLVRSFLADLAEPAEVLVGACHELGGDTLPWAPWVDVVRQLVDRHGVGTVLDRAGPCRAELARLVPLLAVDGDALPGPGAGPARLVDAVNSLLRATAARRPLVVVLEDLHWADTSTADLVPAVVHALADEPALVVATLRLEELPLGAPIRRLVTEIVRADRGELVQLAPLTRAEQARQLTGLLGVPPTRRMLDDVWSRAAGNPFFAEELVAHDGSELPITIHELLVSRLLALPRPTRRLATAAALLGRTVDVTVMRQVLELDEAGFDDVLAPAFDAHVLVGDAAGRPVFRHVLLAEVAARMLLPTEASRLHGRIADALEGGSGGLVGPERTAAVARHRLAAGDRARGLPAAVAAARAMAAMLAFPDALRFHERALAWWDDVPDPVALVGCSHADLLSEAAGVAHLAAEPERAAGWCRAALAEVDEGADPVRSGLLHERLGRYLWMSADGSGAEQAYARAVELVPPVPPTPARARVLSGQAQALMLAGRFPAARRLADQALEVARQAGARSIVGHALNNRGAARVHLGEVDAGLADLDQAREIAEELLDDVDDVLRAIVNRCTALFDVGRLAEAADLALEGVAVARRLGLERRKGVWGRCDAAEALLAVGRIGEAGDLVEEAVAFEPAGIDRVRVLVVSGRLALVRGRLAEAEAALVEGADVGAAVTDEQLVGPIATAMVHLHLAQGDPVAGLEAAEAGWARLPVHDPAFATPLATAALEAAVDATLAGNGSMASADRWLARCRQVARGSSLPLVQAWVATAGAQRTRLDSIPSPRAWESSAAAWDTLGAPLAAAHDRWRQAEALVASGGSRDVARAVARWAEETCRQRGAIGLAAQVRDFVRRARLDAPSGGPDGHGLTPRERDVLRLVADGLTNREIGDRLFIGHRTVATHVSNLLGKLSAASRSEAAVIAVRDGLLN